MDSNLSRVKSAFSSPGWRRLHEIVKIQLTVAAIAFLALLIFIAYGVLPNRWYRVLLVYSGSMSPAFEAGDLIIISRPPKQLQTGMILTLQVNEQLVTHRLVGFDSNGVLVTKGDANPTADDWSGQKVAVRGLYRGCIPYLGHLIDLPKKWIRIHQSGSWYADEQQLALIDFRTGALPPEKTPPPNPPPWPSPAPPTPEPGLSADLSLVAEIVALKNDALAARLCLGNRGSVAPASLTIQSEVLHLIEGGLLEPLPGTGQEIRVDKTLDADQTVCAKVVTFYSLVLGESYIQVFRVSYTNRTGWLPGDPNCPGSDPCVYQDEVRLPFGLAAPAEPSPPAPIEPVNPPTQTPVEPPESQEPTENPTEPPAESPTPEPSPVTPAPPDETPEPTPDPSAAP